MSTNTAMSGASQEHFVSDKDVELFCEKQNVITFPAPPTLPKHNCNWDIGLFSLKQLTPARSSS